MPKPSRAHKHGRSHCKRCLKKLPAGRNFCNANCRNLYINGYPIEQKPLETSDTFAQTVQDLVRSRSGLTYA